MLVEISAQHPTARQVKRVADILREGGVVIYPTDTTYGFACDLFNKRGAEKILAIKRNPKDKLLSLICADLKDVSQYGHLSNSSYKILKRCLPGPFTFILKATPLVPRVMMTKRKTIGIRIPENVFAVKLVEELGHPFITASVRLEKEEIMSEPVEMEARLGHLLGMVIDAGIILPFPSSVVDLSEDTPVIIREGKGNLAFIKEP